MARRKYTSFDAGEWKLQRCQRRLQNLDMDSAFDRAQERNRWSAQRYADRYERERSKDKAFMEDNKPRINASQEDKTKDKEMGVLQRNADKAGNSQNGSLTDGQGGDKIASGDNAGDNSDAVASPLKNANSTTTTRSSLLASIRERNGLAGNNNSSPNKGVLDYYRRYGNRVNCSASTLYLLANKKETD